MSLFKANLYYTERQRKFLHKPNEFLSKLGGECTGVLRKCSCSQRDR